MQIFEKFEDGWEGEGELVYRNKLDYRGFQFYWTVIE
jgi:hypothetical protein